MQWTGSSPAEQQQQQQEAAHRPKQGAEVQRCQQEQEQEHMLTV